MRPLKLSQKPFCIGFPWRNEQLPDDPVVLRPGEHGVRGELGPIVGHDHAGLAAPFDQRRQFGATRRPEIEARDRRQGTPASRRIDDVQDAEPPAAGKPVMDEVHSTSERSAWI